MRVSTSLKLAAVGFFLVEKLAASCSSKEKLRKADEKRTIFLHYSVSGCQLPQSDLSPKSSDGD